VTFISSPTSTFVTAPSTISYVTAVPAGRATGRVDCTTLRTSGPARLMMSSTAVEEIVGSGEAEGCVDWGGDVFARCCECDSANAADPLTSRARAVGSPCEVEGCEAGGSGGPNTAAAPLCELTVCAGGCCPCSRSRASSICIAALRSANRSRIWSAIG
jgi:hypothetical protein